MPEQQQRQQQQSKSTTRTDNDGENNVVISGASPWSCFKSFYSLALLIFCIVIVMALIFDNQTSLAQNVHSSLAFFVMWLALIWLSLVEGGQASMVGLPPIDRELYKDTHHVTHQICQQVHKGDNLDRYLMGRQFMVVVLVFVINTAGAPVQQQADSVLGLPKVVSKIFLDSGLALILITSMIGQLHSQINASHCMLDFINNWGNWFTVQVALAVEASGLLHASYLIQFVVAWLAGKPIESNEDPRSLLQSIWFWFRVFLSCCALILAFVVTVMALFNSKTTMWESIPSVLSLILFFILMSIVGMLEGMQIAFFAVAKLTEEERSTSRWASRTCSLLFEGEGRNLPGFMVGRQLAVVSCFFVIAKVTTMSIDEANNQDNVLGVSDGVQEFFNTGLLGALITTIVASLAWQLVASAFPLSFLANPLTYLLIRLSLMFEATGICNGAWVIAAIHRKLAGFQVDEVYVGTAEERAATNHKDKTVRALAGHLTGGAFPANHDLPIAEQQWLTAPNFSKRRSLIVRNIDDLREQISQAATGEEREIYNAALQKEKASLRKVSHEESSFRRHFFQMDGSDQQQTENEEGSDTPAVPQE